MITLYFTSCDLCKTLTFVIVHRNATRLRSYVQCSCCFQLMARQHEEALFNLVMLLHRCTYSLLTWLYYIISSPGTAPECRLRVLLVSFHEVFYPPTIGLLVRTAAYPDAFYRIYSIIVFTFNRYVKHTGT